MMYFQEIREQEDDGENGIEALAVQVDIRLSMYQKTNALFSHENDVRI